MQHQDDTSEQATAPARDLLLALWRGKLTILVVFLLVSGTATTLALRTPPVFSAESSLLVRIGREYVYQPETGGAEASRTPRLIEMVNSEVEILSSRDLARQVVDQLGVEALYPELLEKGAELAFAAEKAVLAFRQAANIRSIPESTVIKVSFEHRKPEIAASAVNLLVDRFVDKHLEIFGEERTARLESALEQRRTDLTTAEEELTAFKLEKGLFSFPDQRGLALEERARLARELQDCELKLAQMELYAPQHEGPWSCTELPEDLSPDMLDALIRQRNDLEQALRELEPQHTGELVERVSLRMLDLELEEASLLREYAPGSRRIASVRDELQRVRSFLTDTELRADTIGELARAEHDRRALLLQEDLRRLDQEIELLVEEERRQAARAWDGERRALELLRLDLQKRSTAMDGASRDLELQGKTLRRLERTLDSSAAAYAAYKQRTDEARIADELDRDKHISVRVIESAAAPIAPIGLSLRMRIGLAAFVGLLAGGALALLADVFLPRRS